MQEPRAPEPIAAPRFAGAWPRGETLYAFLTRLVLLGMVPLMLLGAWLVISETRKAQAQRRSEATAMAQGGIDALDLFVQERIHGLQSLASSPLAEDPRQWPLLYLEAQTFQRVFGGHVILAGLDRRMIFNTRAPYGRPLPMLPVPKGRTSFVAAVETRQPAVGDLVFGPVAKEPLVTLAVPVLHDGAVAQVLLATFEAAKFQERLDRLGHSRGWMLTLEDGTGSAVARVVPRGIDPAEPIVPANRFSARSALSSWSIEVRIPRTVWQRSVSSAALGLWGALLLAIATGLLVGGLSSRRISLAVASIGREEHPDPRVSGLREIAAVAERLRSASEQRDRLEESLRESEQRFRLVLRNAPVSVAMQDRDLRYVWAYNQRTASPAEIVGRRDSDLFSPAQAAHLEELKGRVLREGVELHEELWLERPSGAIYLSIYWEPIRDVHGEIIGVGSATVDLTPIQRAQEDLRASEEKFALAFAMNPAAVALARLQDSVFLDVNQTWTELMGVGREEALGRSMSSLALWPSPEDHAQFVLELREKGGVRNREQQLQKPSGEPFVAQVSSQLLTMQGEQVVLSTMVDITGLKRAQAEIRELNVGLERRVEERTLALEAVNRELETFAYSVSHDLRAPLRHIKGFMALLAKHLGAALDGEGRLLLDKAGLATDRMGLLVEGLLAFTRLGRVQLHQESVALTRVVAAIIEEFAEECAGREVRWSVGELPVIQGDPTLLHFAFQNLVSNALKFTRNQPRTVIEFQPLEGQEGEVGVSIRDNGIGFDPALASRLFGVFQRLHREDEFEGTGIGLANVQRIVQRHGGRVWAEAHPGDGATFFLVFPSAGGQP